MQCSSPPRLISNHQKISLPSACSVPASFISYSLIFTNQLTTEPLAMQALPDSQTDVHTNNLTLLLLSPLSSKLSLNIQNAAVRRNNTPRPLQQQTKQCNNARHLPKTRGTQASGRENLSFIIMLQVSLSSALSFASPYLSRLV